MIGATAVIGDRVSILHGVTLGGTGKVDGDRHPKVGEGVLIGAQATILGNIKIGKGVKIAAGSLVMKPVPPYAMVAGSPGKVVGFSYGSMPAFTMKQEVKQSFCDEWETAVFEAERAKRQASDVTFDEALVDLPAPSATASQPSESKSENSEAVEAIENPTGVVDAVEEVLLLSLPQQPPSSGDPAEASRQASDEEKPRRSPKHTRLRKDRRPRDGVMFEI